MLAEMLVVLCIGILLGTITGLIPGIHINLVGATLISLSATALGFLAPVYLVILISAMAITHTFIDFIPSILLGCPDSDTELSILPGHELLKQGQGYQAIMLTIYGSIFSIFILMMIVFPFGFLISKFYSLINFLIPYLLLIVSLFLILSEKKKVNALVVFALSGILGLCVLNLENLKEPLLPLLSGLFGSSTIILSIKNKTKIPPQKFSLPKIKLIKPLLGASLSAPICSLLPGLGSGQAAVIGNILVNNKKDIKSFLVLLGATNTLVMGFSFLSLYLISKTRTGAAAAIKTILGTTMELKFLILIMAVVIISGTISFFLAKYLAKFSIINIQKINYTKLSIGILFIILIVTFIVSGFLGIIILAISTATGIYCIGLKVRRTNMMGCLLIPVIVYYLF